MVGMIIVQQNKNSPPKNEFWWGNPSSTTRWRCLLHHDFPRRRCPVRLPDAKQVDALRQAFQADFVGGLGGLHQLAQSVVDPDLDGGYAFDADEAAGGVGGEGDAAIVGLVFIDDSVSSSYD